MKYLKFIVLIIFLGLQQQLFAQKLVKVIGEDTYVAPSNVSLDEAKHTALERAKIKALADEFGTIVSQSRSTVMEVANGSTDTRMTTLAGSQVKGEWIETIGEPEYKITYENNMLVVSVKVEGKARELKQHKLDLQTKVLKNSTDLRAESYEFTDGDNFYIYFRSPVSGYLTIYMEEESTQQVFCLLPYMSSTEGAVKIEQNKDYIFFKPLDAYDRITDTYILYSNHSIDYETIYIVFSPNTFYKANAKIAQTSNTPLQLSHDDFMRWLIENETTDRDLTVVRKNIMIKKK